MTLGALDMFQIGIGPSSSHTIGPMKAALEFAQMLDNNQLLSQTTKIEVHLFGSLALTGEGHGTILAILNGLCGKSPKTINPDSFIPCVEQIKQTGILPLLNKTTLNFDYNQNINLHKQEFLPEHSNGMRFIAFNQDKELLKQEYFSIGGGFILNKEQMRNYLLGNSVSAAVTIPYHFNTAAQLTKLCEQHSLSIAQLVTANEAWRHNKQEVYQQALEIAEVMHQSVERGIKIEGVLPGNLQVKRRAAGLYDKLKNSVHSTQEQRLLAMTFAMAVNEENAAFSKIVTAPTNGAAGTIPGVLEYYRRYCHDVTDVKIAEFILTAGAIGMLYKMGASISAAEVGCQGEIGVACSMAAGALTAVLGGSLIQITKAAEIAMEHSLGMTCDPIAGLVQIPCIERNGVAASRAIDIAKLALLENTPGKVSLDDVIATMLQTGRDMSSHYKETALGGLAVNVVNC